MKYLNGTNSLYLTITATDMGMIKWYVDTLYAIHNDCHGHTGAIMTFGSVLSPVSPKNKK